MIQSPQHTGASAYEYPIMVDVLFIFLMLALTTSTLWIVIHYKRLTGKFCPVGIAGFIANFTLLILAVVDVFAGRR